MFTQTTGLLAKNANLALSNRLAGPHFCKRWNTGILIGIPEGTMPELEGILTVQVLSFLKQLVS